MNQSNRKKSCLKKSITTISTILIGTGCAALTPSYITIEGYRIYDIQTNPNSAITKQISANIKEAIQLRANDVTLNNTIPPATLPETPARYVLTDPFKNATGIFAMANSKNPIKIPRCEGAVIDATSHQSFAGAERTTFFVCLIPYQKGYQLDIYYHYDKVSGGLSTQALGRTLAQSVMGDSSQFIPTTIAALEEAVKEAGVKPVVVDSYPD
ncbi:hypothetical protein [Methylomonas sp. AM2-LC]|uniref:hypothetical protein n=1 Tax=Methylomonas sp. AM2-LC TaxID=3153301 RepID=UPI003266E47C